MLCGLRAYQILPMLPLFFFPGTDQGSKLFKSVTHLAAGEKDRAHGARAARTTVESRILWMWAFVEQAFETLRTKNNVRESNESSLCLSLRLCLSAFFKLSSFNKSRSFYSKRTCCVNPLYVCMYTVIILGD